MLCPNCDGEVWDNIRKKEEKKISPKAPDYKCKDDNCGWLKWPAQVPRSTLSNEAPKETKQPNVFAKSIGGEEDKPDWDAKERRVVRMNVLRHATELAKVIKPNDPIESIKEDAKELEEWVYRE